MRGVSRPGLEYASIDYSSFSSDSIHQEIRDMVSWGLNTLRLPIRDRFWFDEEPYRRLVDLYIETASSSGMVIVLDLHTQKDHALSSEDAMMLRPDALLFWKDVCTVYGGQEGVFFELFNEPYVSDPRVWWDGDTTYNGYGEILRHLRSPDSPCQQTITILGGLDYGYQWSFMTREIMGEMISLGGIVVSTHPYAYRGAPSYDNNCTSCSQPIPTVVQYPMGTFTGNCTIGYTLPQITKDVYDSGWDASFGFLQERFPVVATEFGLDHYETSLQGGWYMNAILTYFRSHRIGYVAWAWVRDRLDYPSLLSPDNTPTGKALSPNPGPPCGVKENDFYAGPGMVVYHDLERMNGRDTPFLLRRKETLFRPPRPHYTPPETKKMTRILLSCSSGLFLFYFCVWWSRRKRRYPNRPYRNRRRRDSCFF